MGTTTNLSLPYPASTDYVANGYLDIENLADAVDSPWGAASTWTPTFGAGSNTTGAAGNFRYRLMGKWLWVQGDFSAGTATAAGSIGVSLPAGVTCINYQQPVHAGNEVAAAGVLYALVGAGGTAVIIYGTAARGNFSAGQSLTGVHFSGWLEVQ